MTMSMNMDPDIESKYAHNAKIMVATAILLFILIILIIFFHTYVRFCRRRRRRPNSHSFPSNSSAPTFKDPLDPSVFKSLPTFTFSSAANHHDCAVCLSEFADGDQGRVLPNCNHAFHAHCIDTWFASHSTCPLCRTTVQPVNTEPGSGSGSGSDSEPGCSSSSLPAPIACTRKPLELSIIIETPEVERASDTVNGDQGFKWTLKSFATFR